MAIMAFIVGVGAMIIFLNLSLAHISDSKVDDMHNTGKRLVETLSGEIFKSEASRSYGSHVLEGNLISEIHSSDSTLQDLVGPIEYKFSAEISRIDCVGDR